MLRILLKKSDFQPICSLFWSISARLLSTKNSLEKKLFSQALVPEEKSKEKNEELKTFNNFAIKDLLLGNFDDDLLYFPEILDKDKWADLIDRGMVIEQHLNAVNYQEVLETGKISDKIRKKLGELNLFKTIIPTKYGGLEYSETENKYIHEIIGIFPSLARMVSENEEMGIRALITYGTEEQKEKYLPRLASGESMIAFAFLEEDSTALDIKSYMGTESVQINDKFFINGEKAWVYNASAADLFIVFATHPVIEENGIIVLNNLFLVDRNSDGVIVHKPMNKKWFRGLDICKVVFQEVSVGVENILGGFGKGQDILIELVKDNKTNTCSECSGIMKKIVHNAIYKCNNNKLLGIPLTEFKHANVIVGEMATLTYAVESLVYYLAARSDYYDKPDLKLEGNMAKVFASEALPEILQLYFNLLGKIGYEKDMFLEEVVQNSNFYSVLDENKYNTKLFVMSECLQYLGRKLSGTIKKIKSPEQNPVTTLKYLMKISNKVKDKPEMNLKLRMAVPIGLTLCADDLEYCVYRLKHCAESHLHRYGKHCLEEDHDVLILCDILIQTYALIACLARASRANFLSLPSAKEEARLALAFGNRTLMKVRNLSSLLNSNHEEMSFYQEIGRKTFYQKSYPAEHPLMRNF